MQSTFPQYCHHALVQTSTDDVRESVCVMCKGVRVHCSFLRCMLLGMYVPTRLPSIPPPSFHLSKLLTLLSAVLLPHSPSQRTDSKHTLLIAAAATTIAVTAATATSVHKRRVVAGARGPQWVESFSQFLGRQSALSRGSGTTGHGRLTLPCLVVELARLATSGLYEYTEPGKNKVPPRLVY